MEDLIKSLAGLRYCFQTMGLSEPYVIRLEDERDLKRLWMALKTQYQDAEVVFTPRDLMHELLFMGFRFTARASGFTSLNSGYRHQQSPPRDDVQHRPQEASYEEAAPGVPELASPPLLLLPPTDHE
jgi:hypothetical protein